MTKAFSAVSIPDLTDVEQRVYAKYEVSRSDARLAVEYLQCLFDAKRRKPDQVVILPQIADWAWHELILDTERYRAMCSRVLGTFLHHLATTVDRHELAKDGDVDARDLLDLEPARALPSLEGSNLRQCFLDSMAMMREVYGLGSGSNPEQWREAGWDSPAYRLRAPIRIADLQKYASSVPNIGRSNLAPSLTWLPSRIARRFGISLDAAECGVKEYSNFFLSLRSSANEQARECSVLCEIAWEEHVLWTKRYAEDCYSFLGYFLEHVPRTVFSEESATAKAA